MTFLRFDDGKIGYVGSCWTSPGVFAVRVFGSKGLMHYEIDFGTWDTPALLHESAVLYIQRGKDGYAKRQEIKLPQSDMFRAELEMFAQSCRTGISGELDAHNGNLSVAVVYAALRSLEMNGQYVRACRILCRMRNPELRVGATTLPSRFFIDCTQPEIAAQLARNPSGNFAGWQCGTAWPTLADRY